MNPDTAKKRDLNLLLLTENLPGGESIAVSRLFKALKTINPAYRFTKFYYPQKTGGVRTNFLNGLVKDFIKSRREINKILKTQKIDYVLSTHYLLTLAFKSLRLYKPRLIHVFHGTKAGRITFDKDLNYRKFIVSLLEKIAFLSADAITIPSIIGRSFVSRYLPISQQKKIFILPNIVTAGFFKRYEATKVKQQLGIPAKNKIILYSGRISKYKGLENLAAAFKSLAASQREVNLIFAFSSVVDGGLFLSLKRILDNEIKDKKVIFLQGLAADEIVKIYNSANILILPSELEFAPLVVIEAFASGTPVVSTDVGNCSELLNKVDKNLLLKNNRQTSITEKLREVLGYGHLKLKKISTKEVLIAKKYSETNASKDFERVINFLD